MKLLLTNDDGIDGKGIISLANALKGSYEILVVAPQRNHSSTGHSMTIGKPLRLTKMTAYHGVEAYSFDGTPADCVKFAAQHFAGHGIDAVVSGINNDHNVGSDVMYSGTVAAAFEAAYLGFPAIALSASSRDPEHYDAFAKIAANLLPDLFALQTQRFIWNVNFPEIAPEKIKGVSVTPLGVHRFDDHYDETDENCFSLNGQPITDQINPVDCDVNMIHDGFITATPLLCNRTDMETVERLRSAISFGKKS